MAAPAPLPGSSPDPRLQMDPQAARRLIQAMLVVAALQLGYVGLIVGVYPDQMFRVPAALVGLAVCLACAYPVRKGDGQRAIQWLAYGGFIYVAASTLTTGGLAAPIIIVLPMLILIPGILLGRLAVSRFALLVTSLCVVLLVIELAGWLSQPAPMPTLLRFLTITIVLGVAWVMVNFALRAQRQRLNEIVQLNAQLTNARAIAENSAREFATLADNLPAMVVRLDANLRIRYVNSTFLAISRTRPEPGLNRTLDEFCTHEQIALFRPALDAARRGERTVFLLPGHTATYLFEVTMIAERDADGQFLGYLLLLNDVTERERLQVELRRAATHDALTGLANRMSLDGLLEQALALANREQGLVALMAIDLDGFKPVNDTWGHAAGDALLRHVAARMRQIVRAADTVARVGGDEFVILLTRLAQPSDVTRLADKILAAIQTPTHHEGHELTVGASIGIALFPQHGLRPSELHEAADAAMYAAKRSGKARYCVAPTP